MAGKTSTSPLSMPLDTEIQFPSLRRQSFLLVKDSGGPRAAEFLWEIAETIAGRAVRVPVVDPGYQNLDAISEVYAALLPVVRKEAPELLPGSELPEGLFSMDPYRVRQIGIEHLGEAVTFAVTRRISRESHDASLVIDRIARTLLEIRRRCASFANGLTLVVPGLERWDRPSLRCLYRALLLAGPDDRLSVVATAARAAERGNGDPDDPWARIAPARERFLATLASAGMVRTARIPGAPERPETDDGQLVSESLGEGDQAEAFRRFLLTMGDALVMQNYERVYHLAPEALGRAADPEQEAQARRLVGIADAQLDDYGSAIAELERAIGLTADPAFAAHLNYLCGLIATKRNYDLDGAVARYDQGLAALDNGPGDDQVIERRLERAWLHNGKALVCALRAKSVTDPAERERLLTEAFNLEFSAFAMVRDARGAASSYLRHNLMANLTFLLEISSRFDEAVSFWRKAFEPYLASDSRRFRVSFDARLGALLAKAGKPDEGAEILENARQVCIESGDLFGDEELCLKLGFFYAAAGKPERAFTAYRDGLRVGHRLREADICVDALTGMLWCLAELGADDEFKLLADTVRRALPATALAERLLSVPDTVDLTRALRDAGITRPVPSPKMRAYIPGVDLEGTPTQDLNRYLVWGEGGLPVTPAGNEGPR
jgi:tetratricopeptide (TPR) repeat protein